MPVYIAQINIVYSNFYTQRKNRINN